MRTGVPASGCRLPPRVFLHTWGSSSEVFPDETHPGDKTDMWGECGDRPGLGLSCNRGSRRRQKWSKCPALKTWVNGAITPRRPGSKIPGETNAGPGFPLSPLHPQTLPPAVESAAMTAWGLPKPPSRPSSANANTALRPPAVSVRFQPIGQMWGQPGCGLSVRSGRSGCHTDSPGTCQTLPARKSPPLCELIPAAS